MSSIGIPAINHAWPMKTCPRGMGGMTNVSITRIEFVLPKKTSFWNPTRVTGIIKRAHVRIMPKSGCRGCILWTWGHS